MRRTLRLGRVRRCEIVGGASRFLVATHPRIAIYMAARIPMI
ncbi:MAG: hypothetical protein QQW96_23895 [Tychonema bourrellyi B0820]|nr:hypothetical protein [Tychonema bourrellyi B0820]